MSARDVGLLLAGIVRGACPAAWACAARTARHTAKRVGRRACDTALGTTLTAAVAVTTALTACASGGGDGGAPVAPGPTVRAVRVISNRTATVDETGSVALVATATAADGSSVGGTAFAWTSLDPSVATVDGTGVVHAVAPGVAHVVVAAPVAPQATPDTATITVTAAQVAKVVASDSALPAALAVGDTGTVQAALLSAGGTTLAPTNGRAVTWASAAPGIVQITPDGHLTALATGAAVLTATSGAAGTAGNGAAGSITVQVLAAPFRVVFAFDASVPSAVQTAARAAARRWEHLIAQGSPAALDRRTSACDPEVGLAPGQFAVALRVAPSPEGPYTGAGGPNCLRTDYQGAASGVVLDTGIVSSAYAPGPQGPAFLAALVAHEIGHGLGIGSWRYQSPAAKVDATLTMFLGAQAATAWQGLGGSGNAPVQPNNSAAHWSEPGGLCGELMAPHVSSASVISSVSLGALTDLGWTVRSDRAEAYVRKTC